MSIEAIQAVFDGSLEDEVLSPGELQQAIELELRYEQRRNLVLTARNQQHAAEWLVDHSPLTEEECSVVNKEADAYRDVFHEYFHIVAGRSITN